MTRITQQQLESYLWSAAEKGSKKGSEKGVSQKRGQFLILIQKGVSS